MNADRVPNIRLIANPIITMMSDYRTPIIARCDISQPLGVRTHHNFPSRSLSNRLMFERNPKKTSLFARTVKRRSKYSSYQKKSVNA